MPLSKFNNENYVAKYTTFDRVIKDILPFNEIRVSSAHNVNDPYENDKDWFGEDRSVCFQTAEEWAESQKNFFNIKEKLFFHIKLFCTTEYKRRVMGESDISDNIYCKPRMWATYGDNHKGVCLIFDKKELSLEFDKLEETGKLKKVYSGEVKYIPFLSHVNNNILICPNVLKNIYTKPDIYDKEKLYSFIKNYSKNDLFKTKYFYKHSDWESESEYRWLVFSNGIEDLNINYGNSLKGIVLGINVDSKYIRLFEKYTSIPLYKISYSDNKYKAYEL